MSASRQTLAAAVALAAVLTGCASTDRSAPAVQSATADPSVWPRAASPAG